MKNLIVVILVFASCGNKAQQKQVNTDTVTASIVNSKFAKVITSPISYRQCKNLSASFLEQADSVKKRLLIEIFPEDFETITSDKIVSIQPQAAAITVDQYGICQVSEIKLSDDLPSVMSRKMYLLFNKDRQQGVILQMEDFQPIKIRIADSTILLAGTYLVRDKGYFAIYKYDKKGGFTLIFDSSSDNYCGNGIAAYNNSLDCISYSPFLLKLENKDVTNDGINDLVFTGKVLFFCQGLESGYGRKDRKPLKEQELRIVFETALNADTLSWQLSDTTVCRLMEQ